MGEKKEKERLEAFQGCHEILSKLEDDEEREITLRTLATIFGVLEWEMAMTLKLPDNSFKKMKSRSTR